MAEPLSYRPAEVRKLIGIGRTKLRELLSSARSSRSRSGVRDWSAGPRLSAGSDRVSTPQRLRKRNPVAQEKRPKVP